MWNMLCVSFILTTVVCYFKQLIVCLVCGKIIVIMVFMQYCVLKKTSDIMNSNFTIHFLLFVTLTKYAKHYL